MKNNKAFTLIELLAVIIILGILMIIAIPSVTSYISESRKSIYIDTAKELIGSARNVVNNGKLGMYDSGTTYYIPVQYLKTENGLQSPYGDFTQAYIGITYDGKGYDYYWISTDETGQGIDRVTLGDKLDVYDIKSDLLDENIRKTVETTGIGGRDKILILNIETGQWEEPDGMVTNLITEEGYNLICRKAKTLHTATCTATQDGCFADGYVEGNKGTTITYGTIPSGEPKKGDAYDCKVTKSGGYTERFYLISKFNDSVDLIYYKNMNGQQGIPYDASGDTSHGPRTAASLLPTRVIWDNPLIPQMAYITLVKNGSIVITSFNYLNYAVKIPGISSIISACDGGNYFNSVYGGGNKMGHCNFLFENIGRYESNSGISGYWLFDPIDENSPSVYMVVANKGHVSYTSGTSSAYGVRPVLRINSVSLER